MVAHMSVTWIWNAAGVELTAPDSNRLAATRRVMLEASATILVSRGGIRKLEIVMGFENSLEVGFGSWELWWDLKIRD